MSARSRLCFPGRPGRARCARAHISVEFRPLPVEVPFEVVARGQEHVPPGHRFFAAHTFGTHIRRQPAQPFFTRGLSRVEPGRESHLALLALRSPLLLPRLPPGCLLFVGSFATWLGAITGNWAELNIRISLALRGCAARVSRLAGTPQAADRLADPLPRVA